MPGFEVDSPKAPGVRLDATAGDLTRDSALGGLRIVYYVFAAERQIWLVTIYDKDEAENLTAEQCRLLRSAIHDELRARRGDA